MLTLSFCGGWWWWCAKSFLCLTQLKVMLGWIELWLSWGFDNYKSSSSWQYVFSNSRWLLCHYQLNMLTSSNIDIIVAIVRSKLGIFSCSWMLEFLDNEVVLFSTQMDPVSVLCLLAYMNLVFLTYVCISLWSWIYIQIGKIW